jgi:hypothetical protein
MRAGAPLLLLLVGACTSEPPPPPRVLCVDPPAQAPDRPQDITVTLDTDPPLTVDYGQPSARLRVLPRLRLGDLEPVSLDTYLGHGRFMFHAESLPGGDYPLRVDLGEGLEALAPSAYTVSLRGGSRQVKYSINPVGPQVLGRDIPLTLLVEVPDGLACPLFARLRVYKNGSETGPALPVGPLVQGENSYALRAISEPGDDYVVRIIDGQGNYADSQSFGVADPTH